MINNGHKDVLPLLTYKRLPKKPSLFKSFTGLIVQEFYDIFDKEITKKCENYEIQRLSKRKGGKNRKRKISAIGRPFKIDVKNRFLMRLYQLAYVL